MDDGRMELEMRIAGLDSPDGVARAERALREVDPAASLRRDPATGIAHIVTTRQALEIEEALTRAGLTVTAATG